VTLRPTVQDIQTYLFDTGWQRQPQTWNDASIWSNADGREVLVPSSDELADTDLRVAEIMSALTVVEGRPAGEIAGDINTPFDDVQLYRAFPDDDFISLAAGLLMLRSMRDLISVAARTVVDGPHPVLPGVTPRPVNDLLQLIRLGPDRSADHLFTVRIPLTSAAGSPGNGQPWIAADTTPLGRQIGHQLRAAVVAAQAAAEQATEQDLTAFDESVAAGVSANLCEALSGLSGRQRTQPFEIAFRWGRGLRSDVPADAVRFPGGTGTTFRAGAARLRQLASPLGITRTAAVTGLVQSLHGQSPNDGWRINIHGDLFADGSVDSGRTVPVWLDSQITYDRAIAAHRSGQRVRAHGELSGSGGRTELIVHEDNFETLEGDA
jgi:hypothetical protein